MSGTVTVDGARRGSRERARLKRAGARTVVVPVVGPGLLAFVMSVAWSWRPSYWLDETATVAAVTRPLSALPGMLRHVDAVHGAYYLLLWPWVRAGGVAEWWVRLPSAVAEAGAAAAVVGIGWQLAGQRVGVVSGLVFAVLPVTSLYGSTARSQALQTLLVAAATFFLLRWCRSGRFRWAAAYSLTMAAAVVVFLFAATFLLAHLLYVLVARRRAAAVVPLLVPALATVLLGLATRAQDGQVSWIQRPVVAGLPRFLVDAFAPSDPVLAVVVAFACLAGVVALIRLRDPVAAGGLALALGLAILPTLALFTASQLHPVLVPRYVAASTVGISLLVGAASRAVPGAAAARLTGVVAVVAVAAVGMPTQISLRQPVSRGPDYVDGPREALASAAARQLPGDVLSFPDGYISATDVAYPVLTSDLPDISAGVGRVQSRSLFGYRVADPTYRRRLDGVRRVWLVAHQYRPGLPDGAGDAHQAALLTAAGFTETDKQVWGRTVLELWAR